MTDKPGHKDFPSFTNRVKEEAKQAARPKIFDPFEGKMPTTQQAADELARISQAAYAADLVVRRLQDEIAQHEDRMNELLVPLIQRGVLKTGTTYEVPGGFVTLFGVPDVRVFFTKKP